ncbi:MAG: RdgB/HAM1 family non-canonical purine NTP pyrophosphatase [Burkholderiales bacterium]|nr:RdgB/HAM1 family non-canonical purine NTP pyrophosphatase [Burkholderiales bacterium]
MIETKPQQIILASNNCGKIREFSDIFANIEIKITAQNSLGISEIDEPYSTFVENALHKARHCARQSGQMALADDSGLCVRALQGRPGVYSARYAGIPKNDFNNNQKLIADLSNIADRSAYFYCVLVLVRSESDPQPIITDGVILGEIIDIPRGSNGFGYDAHFYLKQYGKTMAELEPQIKNQVSHRRLAINNLLLKLKEITNGT